MNRTRRTPRKEAKPDGLHFHFRWSGLGLTILESPTPLELYRLPPILQQSLGSTQNDGRVDGEHCSSNEWIPVGFLAQMLHRAPWGNLNLNFEATPNGWLFLYLSLGTVLTPRPSTPLAIKLIRDTQRIPATPFRQGKYASPPLEPGCYTFVITGGAEAWTKVFVRLEGSENSRLEEPAR